MKILLTVHEFFPRYRAGTEVLTYSVARELIRRGHTVRVLTGHPGSEDLGEQDRYDEYDYEGIHVYRFHHAYTPMAGQRSMIAVDYDNPLAPAYFDSIVEEFKPDLVHFFHLNRLGSRLIEQAVAAGIPCFMTPTDFWSFCPTSQLVLRNGHVCSGPSVYGGNCIKHFAEITQGGAIRTAARLLPTFVADWVSQLTLKGVLRSYPKCEEVTAIAARLRINIGRINQLSGLFVPNGFMHRLLIEHGVSPDIIIPSAYGIDVASSAGTPRAAARTPLHIGFIGTLAKHKGCHILIAAFNSLPPGQAVLKIYGDLAAFPDYSAMLKRLAADNPAIQFCGTFQNSQIGTVLAALDVLVVPSLWYENTPLVVYSAQAAHCPVIASNFPGISEVVHDDENGLLFQAGRAEALSECLARCIADRGLIARLSMRCRSPKSTASYVDELISTWTKTMAERIS